METLARTMLAGLAAMLLAAPALAQSVDTARLDEIARQLQQLKDQNERLQAEVEYLRANALEERKQIATDEVTLNTLNSTAGVGAGRWTWSGDLRYRHEWDDAEENATSRNRERIRVRFGMAARVNDSINARVQLSTINPGNDNSRSLNQTLGTGWDRKSVGFDLAYVDWKAGDTTNVLLGKMPIPFQTTASYIWDKDITPEGIAVKYLRGPLFAGAYYFAVNNRDSAGSSLASRDAETFAGQVGMRKSIGALTLTGALQYFDFTGLQDQVAAGTGTGCTIDGAFGSGQGTGNNAFGNTTYTGGALNSTGSGTSCVRLLNDYNLVAAMLQADFNAGRYPVTVFMDYMKNNGVAATQTNRQDTSWAAGFLFNRALAAHGWELGYTWQKFEKDGVWTGFSDSDFGGGRSDTEGGVLKLAFIPVAGWTLNTQYFMNRRFIDPGDSTPTKTYKRLQLDLNYRY